MRRLYQFVIVLFVAVTVAYAGLYLYTARQDKVPPVITFDEEEIAVAVGTAEEELLQGVTASDARDGDVTASLIVEGISSFDTEMKREVTYVAFDKSGNVSKATRKLSYTDYVSPRFTLVAPLTLNLEESVYATNYVKAIDCVDGDITNKIRVRESELDPTREGLYTLTLSVQNSCGDMVERTFDVEVISMGLIEETNTPKIQLSDYLVYLSKGSKFNGGDYLTGVEDDQDQDLLDRVGYDDEVVDTDVPGMYTVNYRVTDSDGYTGRCKLVVIVE